MSTGTLPPLYTDVPKVFFTCFPNPVMDDPGATHAFKSVVLALTRLAEGGYEVVTSRERIAKLARVSISTVVLALRWMKGNNRIDVLHEPGNPFVRRYVLIWERVGPGDQPSPTGPPVPPDDPSHQSHPPRGAQPSGARRATSGRLSGGGAQPSGASLAIPLREKREEKTEKNVPCRPVPGNPRPHEPTIPTDDTARHGSSASSGGQQDSEGAPPEEPPPPSPAPAGATASASPPLTDDVAVNPPSPEQVAEWMRNRGRKGPLGVAAWIGLASWRLGADGQVEAIPRKVEPEKTRPAYAPGGTAGGKPPPRSRTPPPDQRAFLDELRALAGRLDDPASGLADVDRLADLLCRRFGDTKAQTREHNRKVVMNLSADRLVDLAGKAETRSNPANWFATASANELAEAERFRRRRRSVG